MAEHKLKTWTDFWDAIACGEKNFEIRKNDRGYQKGDLLILQKFDRETHTYVLERRGESLFTERPKELRARVTYVLNGMGIEEGYVALGIRLEATSGCCEMMKHHLDHTCTQHPDPYDCGDSVVVGPTDKRPGAPWGLPVHDGSHSHITIKSCPWCASILKREKNDEDHQAS